MHFSFVLVEPAVSENVGACARALNTMGFKDLRLVNPCDYKNMAAKKLAHGSYHILEVAKVFLSLPEAVKDTDFIIGTSAKKRDVKQNYFSITELHKLIERKGNSIKNISIVFGREESGLTNSEIALCDIISNIPIIKAYPSLNLSQAVMLYSYEFSKYKMLREDFNDTGIQNDESFKQLKKKVNNFLDEIELPVIIKNRLMERISIICEEDVNLLHSLYKFIDKKGL